MRARGAELEATWTQAFDAYRTAEPELAALFEWVMSGELPDGWEDALPTFGPDDKPATRAASGTVLNAIAARAPEPRPVAAPGPFWAWPRSPRRGVHFLGDSREGMVWISSWPWVRSGEMTSGSTAILPAAASVR